MKKSNYIARRRFFTRSPSLILVFLATLRMLMPVQPVFAGDAHAVQQINQATSGGSGNSLSQATSGSGASALNGANIAAAQRTQQTIEHTKETLQAFLAAQKVARQTAISTVSTVPNGLTAGGLVPDSGLAAQGVANAVSTWKDANTPTQTTDGNQTIVTVEQTRPQAVLNWSSYNVGKDTTLKYQQGGTDWVALNHVLDPSGVPSQIAGSIQAPGAIYILNQNGIVFRGSSQVNARTVVASSLSINENLVKRGLVDNPDVQYLFSSLPIPKSGNTDSFTPPAAPLGYSGDVIVEQGAEIQSSSTDQHVGGLVALVGPNVENAGSISTPDGQTVLAAGQQVSFLAHDTTDPSLRGLDVKIGEVNDPAAPTTGGTAKNSGYISSDRGNVTITGKEVVQNGVIESTTSVALNGRVDLLANYLSKPYADASGGNVLNPTATGSILIGDNSIISLLPEWDSSEKVTGTELSLHSQVNLNGKSIYFGKNSSLLAPSAEVSILAGEWQQIPNSLRAPNLVATLGQVYLDEGSVIDVAGSLDVASSLGKFLVPVELRGDELKDSPLQRTGVLRGKTVYVDMRDSGNFDGADWVGSPIGGLFGYQNLIQSTVGELTAQGGSINISAGESVVMRPGSSLNVSGGTINYQGALMKTTKVISQGTIYNISQATPDLIYSGIVPFDQYGSDSAYFQPGYIQGANGGSLSISSSSMALDGDLLGAATTGPNQRLIQGASSIPHDAIVASQFKTLPNAGTLNLNFQSIDPNNAAHPLSANSPTPPTVTFENSQLNAADDFSVDPISDVALALRGDRKADVQLSPSIFTSSGFGQLNLDNQNGSIIIPEGTTLAGRPGGSLSLVGANINVEGSIQMRSGKVSIQANDRPIEYFRSDDTSTPLADNTRGHLVMGGHSTIDVSGLLLDDRVASSSAFTLPLLTSGGSVNLSALYTDLRDGSSIDVSGGAAIGSNNKIIYGAGGSIFIQGGLDPVVADLIGGSLHLGSSLRGYAGGQGGSISIVAPLVQVDNSGNPDTPDSLVLNSDFFSQGGFRSFSLTGLGESDGAGGYFKGVRIASGTVIDPEVTSLILDPGSLQYQYTILPENLRSPESLQFNASGVTDLNSSSSEALVRGDLLVEAGARIVTDGRGSITLKGQTVDMRGSAYAPGGSINVAGSGLGRLALHLNGNDDFVPTVYLENGSELSTSGRSLLTFNLLGLHTGTVLNGGNVSVSGNIVAESGSRISVSGARDVLDLEQGYSLVQLDPKQAENPFSGLSQPIVPTSVESSAGTISFAGNKILLVDSTLEAKSGGASAMGGTLSISSGSASVNPTPLDVNIYLQQSIDGKTIPTSFAGIGNSVFDQNGNTILGGHFDSSRLSDSGIDSLTMAGNVQYAGDVTLSLARSVNLAKGGLLYSDTANPGTLNIKAPYVAIGQSPLSPQKQLDQDLNLQQGIPLLGAGFGIEATPGNGKLIVEGTRLIDVGNLSLQNISESSFLTDNGGEIRGAGTLEAAGSLKLRASQIYPQSATTFNIIARDAGLTTGSIEIQAAGSHSLPLSAGGQLNLYAHSIVQDGTLRAPGGIIRLGASAATADPWSFSSVPLTSDLKLSENGPSVTSVSLVGDDGVASIIPYGTILNGEQWIDPQGVDITLGLISEKQVFLSADNLSVNAGAKIDLSGGGDLLASEWIPGLGGSKDILAGSKSFAIIPGYEGVGGDIGFSGSGLNVGDRVYLSGIEGLSAGYYTLLPAKYALLKGAMLVTPKSGKPIGVSQQQYDGSWLVSGYRQNSLNPDSIAQPLISQFEIASAEVFQKRAEYQKYSANDKLKEAAIAHDINVPRLALDAGQLVVSATSNLGFHGSVIADKPAGGLGSLVDIASSVNIQIGDANTASLPGFLTIDASVLNAMNAESLLVGGYRSHSDDGLQVNVLTPEIVVDNSSTPLLGTDMILVSKDQLTLNPGAQILQAGVLSKPAETLIIGDPATPGSGNGLLVRVSGSDTAELIRNAVDSSSSPVMTVGNGVILDGAKVILDSTGQTIFDSNSKLAGKSLAFNSGQISLQLDNAGNLFSDPTHPVTTGLVLSKTALDSLLGNAESLSFSSYSSLDIYGDGNVGSFDVVSGSYAIKNLALHAAEIRGFNNNQGRVNILAGNIVLDNTVRASPPGSVLPTLAGSALNLQASTINLGAGNFNIDQYDQVTIGADQGVLLHDTGKFHASSDFTVVAPVILADGIKADQTLQADGKLSIQNTSSGISTLASKTVGSKLSLVGNSIDQSSLISLPIGTVTLRATGVAGDISIGGKIDVAGTEQNYFGVHQNTPGGTISLISDHGSVQTTANSVLNVGSSGDSKGGLLNIVAKEGSADLAGSLVGTKGNFAMDVGFLDSTFANGNFASLDVNSVLNAGGFDNSRSFRVRNGNVRVDQDIHAHQVAVSADDFNGLNLGSIEIGAKIDASGLTGGSISIYAANDLILKSGSELDVSAQKLDNASKGGVVNLQTRSTSGGVIDVQSGSTIDLSVAGGIGGVLNLRAPQTSGFSDVAINQIGGSIVNASAINIEGYRGYDASFTTIDALKSTVFNDASSFINNDSTVVNKFGGLGGSVHIRPGIDIFSSGNLTLNSDWDLSQLRFGPNINPNIQGSGEAGILTLRAAGNLVLNGSLSDGFMAFDPSTNQPYLLYQQPLLSAGMDSWSYRLTAGADLLASDFHELAGSTSSLLLGKHVQTPFLSGLNTNAKFVSDIPGFTYQVIRTGTGDIDISAAKDVLLLNQWATIYTAGSQVSDPTLGGSFDTPITAGWFTSSALGNLKGYDNWIGGQLYPAQYSENGGNVSIFAQNNIAHMTRRVANDPNSLVLDSELQLPMNWLYRRGSVGDDGTFATGLGGDKLSTTWWVSFMNFFEGVGALGGGNVSMNAGNDIANVDALVPTNARMPKGVPDASALLQLGGGDLTVQAGHDINGGVYYVERGNGVLQAGNDVTTNVRRSPSTASIPNFTPATPPPASASFLPTTIFLGDAKMDVSAGGDLLICPAANVFMQPQGVGNQIWYKSNFSTFTDNSALELSSLTGDITIRQTDTPNENAPGLLFKFMQNVNQSNLTPGAKNVSVFEPWVRTVDVFSPSIRNTANESGISGYLTASALTAPEIDATSISGDVTLIGNLLLSPSSTGTVNIFADGSINGLSLLPQSSLSSGKILISDANPVLIPGIVNPVSIHAAAVLPSIDPGSSRLFSQPVLWTAFNSLFKDTGSTTLTLENKQLYHAEKLHDADQKPIHLFAREGDISGLTLFSPKESMISAGRDITDIALFLQNMHDDDITVISAGRDIVSYNPNSELRSKAGTGSNALLNKPLSGDIQIGGPGSLEVLAGRNLDLGVGGTGLGITSIGNLVNPSLNPQTGANIVAGAGLGSLVSSDAVGLDSSRMDFSAFKSQFLDPAHQASAVDYLPELGRLIGLVSTTTDSQIWNSFKTLSEAEQNRLALNVFYEVLRDSGRALENRYEDGFRAISALFPENRDWFGNISMTSKEIATKKGGDISILVPGGELTVGLNVPTGNAADQGILTEHGGDISIFTDGNVNVGTSRIFTLFGGNEILWSSYGDIAAGSSAKTVQAAPPTRVLIDPQSAMVELDLAGLATGGGIGTLNSIPGAPPSDVDFIAKNGAVDAGDAGLRVSGNLNIAAEKILNAANITVGGNSAGVPSQSAAPEVSTASASLSAPNKVASSNDDASQGSRPPDLFTVEVLAFGDSAPSEDDDYKKRKRKAPVSTEEKSSAQVELKKAPIL